MKKKKYFPKAIITAILICTIGLPIAYNILGASFFGNITNINILRIMFSSVLIPYALFFDALMYTEHKQTQIKINNPKLQEKKETEHANELSLTKEKENNLSYDLQKEIIKTKKLVKKK